MSIINQWIAEFNGFVMTDSNKKKEKAKQICDYVIDLESQIEQLKREHQDEITKLAKECTEHQRGLRAENARLSARVDYLKKGLYKYGDHKPNCTIYELPESRKAKCSCGYFITRQMKEQS